MDPFTFAFPAFTTVASFIAVTASSSTIAVHAVNLASAFTFAVIRPYLIGKNDILFFI